MHQPGEGVSASRHEAEGLRTDVVIDHRVRDAISQIVAILLELFRRRRIDGLLAFPLLRNPLERHFRLMVRSLFFVQHRARKRWVFFRERPDGLGGYATGSYAFPFPVCPDVDAVGAESGPLRH